MRGPGEKHGGMVDPVSLTVAAIGGVYAKVGQDEAAAVLREIVGLQDEQLKLLASIERKVDALLAEPFYTGRRTAASALEPWRPASERTKLLHEARSCFTRSISQDPIPVRRSLAAMHLAGVWLVLRSPQDVRIALEEAHVFSIEAMLAELNSEPRGFQALRKRQYSATRFGLAIYHLGHYVNALARAARQWGAPATRVPLFFAPDREISAEDELRRDVAEAEDIPAFGLTEGRFRAAHAVRSRPGYEQALAEVKRGEILLWRQLSAWNHGWYDEGPRAELPFWQVLRDHHIRPQA
jgi:hypothetical protein